MSNCARLTDYFVFRLVSSQRYFSVLTMFALLQAKVDIWKQQCLDLDVVFKEGHLMLQQDSSGASVAFDEKLGSLNMEWHTVILDVEEKKKTIEKTAKKWWDFTRNKLKMIRWLKKKESDADMQNSVTCRIDSAHDQLTAYQVLMEICAQRHRNIFKAPARLVRVSQDRGIA